MAEEFIHGSWKILIDKKSDGEMYIKFKNNKAGVSFYLNPRDTSLILRNLDGLIVGEIDPEWVDFHSN